MLETEYINNNVLKNFRLTKQINKEICYIVGIQDSIKTLNGRKLQNNILVRQLAQSLRSAI